MTAVWIALIAVFVALIPVFMQAQKAKGRPNSRESGSDAGPLFVADASHSGARDPGQHHHLSHDHGHHGGGHHDGGGHDSGAGDGGGSDGGGGGGSD